MYTTKLIGLEPNDKITTLTHDILYHGVQNTENGPTHILEVLRLTENYSMPWFISAEEYPQISLGIIETKFKYVFYGAKLFRQMKVADMLEHEKFLDKRKEEKENSQEQ